MADFIRCYKSRLEDPARFTIFSFHDCGGVVIDDDVEDPLIMIRKQVGDPLVVIPVDDRRPGHVAFVTYDIVCDFGPLILMNAPQGSSTLNLTTVCRLPQSTRPVLNAGGAVAPVAVTTYYGPADISGMTRQELVTKIITHTRHTGDASLIEPDFG